MISLLQFDITKYEDRVPDVADIKRVHLSEGPYLYLQPERNKFYLKEKTNIQLVHDLHKEIISNKNSEKTIINQKETAFFVYELKNGKKLVREYEINKNEYVAYYKPIHESKEYKEVTYPLFNLTTDKVNLITIDAMGLKNDRAVISEKAEIEEFMTILKEEILASTYEEMYSTNSFKSNISFTLNKSKDNYEFIDVTALSSYKKLQNWLAERELIDNAYISEEDIDYAIVLKREDLEIDPEGYSNLDVFTNMKSNPNAQTFNNKNQIKELMEITEDAYIPESKETYVVAYKIKNQHEPYLGTFDQSEAPIYVNDKFK